MFTLMLTVLASFMAFSNINLLSSVASFTTIVLVGADYSGLTLPFFIGDISIEDTKADARNIIFTSKQREIQSAGAAGFRRGVEAKERLRKIRKRMRRGKGASLRRCSRTLAKSTVYSSSSSATIATRIIFAKPNPRRNLFSNDRDFL
ncbi:hypothetical protein KFK09_007959 [Dendrobium nobile]|uniref:Uncharacterized protein n=1 Tax=Dendrobium nobile TaxID=94219 RepID=A0A8T3BYB5_DENNO|nr:hypothetical protein KFK09_007959 [Dendrobium nobile]